MPAPKRKPIGEGTRYADLVMQTFDDMVGTEADRDDMRLPSGKVCSDCAHWRRCKGLIQTLCPMGDACDFAPSRFLERKHG